jgi:hypothetical protein
MTASATANSAGAFTLVYATTISPMHYTADVTVVDGGATQVFKKRLVVT